jgi:hypothetical protein
VIDRVFVLATALSLAACGPVRAVIAPVDEYAAYRPSRTSFGLEQRIEAASQYLAKYPEGAFVEAARADLARDETAFYASKRGSIAGLEAYLRILPKGKHAGEASNRLTLLRSQRAQREEAGVAEAAEAEHARVSAQRVRVRETVMGWVAAFLDPAPWKSPLVDAPRALIVPWALSLPTPVCADIEPPEGARARRCVKRSTLRYMVPIDGAPSFRDATIEVVIIQDRDGKPLEATIGGPDLMIVLEEARTVRDIRRKDSEARIEAIVKGIELVRREVEKHFPIAPACTRNVVAPAVLSLACGGADLRVDADVDGEDRIVMTPPK